jgi:D-alanyl-D-alanine carboxypeptidase
VSKYIGEAPISWRDITIREILSHSGGLPLDAPGFEPYAAQADSITIRSLFNTRLLFSPGTNFSYSNADYFVAAEIIKRVSGMSWQQFEQTRIFKPLAMNHTQVTSTSAIVPHRTPGYIYSLGEFLNAENWIAVRPSGAFLSTVMDMAKWDQALFGGKILTDASCRAMWAPVKLPNGQTIPYGLGWGLTPYKGHERVFHDGGLPGFSADYEHFIKEGLAVVVLCNTQGIEASEITLHIADMYLQPSK